MLLTNLFVQVQTMFTVHISLNDIIFSQGLHFFFTSTISHPSLPRRMTSYGLISLMKRVVYFTLHRTRSTLH